MLFLAARKLYANKIFKIIKKVVIITILVVQAIILIVIIFL